MFVYLQRCKQKAEYKPHTHRQDNAKHRNLTNNQRKAHTVQTNATMLRMCPPLLIQESEITLG